MTNKFLKKEALAQYNMDSKEAIVQQITNGKVPCHLFGEGYNLLRLRQ